MNYQVLLHQKAKKELNKIPKEVKQSVINGIKSLSAQPKAKGKKLKPTEYYRIRIGDYRVIYEVEENQVIVLMIGHRSKIYYNFEKLR